MMSNPYYQQKARISGGRMEKKETIQGGHMTIYVYIYLFSLFIVSVLCTQLKQKEGERERVGEKEREKREFSSTLHTRFSHWDTLLLWVKLKPVAGNVQ